MCVSRATLVSFQLCTQCWWVKVSPHLSRADGHTHVTVQTGAHERSLACEFQGRQAGSSMLRRVTSKTQSRLDGYVIVRQVTRNAGSNAEERNGGCSQGYYKGTSMVFSSM